MKLYEVENHNGGFRVMTWVNPEMITKIDVGGEIKIPQYDVLAKFTGEYDIRAERSVWINLRDRSSVWITWEAWEKLRAAAGIEVEVL